MPKRISKADRAGLYITVIIHLAVLIVLLLTGLNRSLRSEQSFVIDFSREEELERMAEQVERLRKEAEMQEAINRRLEEKLGNADNGSYRNIAVDRSKLKDDRGTDAEQLYKDAERLAKELKSGFDAPEEVDYADPGTDRKKPESNEEANYSGPSVVSYELAGRKASRLSVPAYRCMGDGQVKVIIGVDPSGKVVSAKVDESCSSTDGCLRSFAIRAARLSKFSASSSAPARQGGYIIYEFIRQ